MNIFKCSHRNCVSVHEIHGKSTDFVSSKMQSSFVGSIHCSHIKALIWFHSPKEGRELAENYPSVEILTAEQSSFRGKDFFCLIIRVWFPRFLLKLRVPLKHFSACNSVIYHHCGTKIAIAWPTGKRKHSLCLAIYQSMTVSAGQTRSHTQIIKYGDLPVL